MKVMHYPRTFREWMIDVTLVKTQDDIVYFPIAQVCEGIGLNAKWQLERLRSDPDYAPGLEELPVPTAGGTQKMICIRKKELAWWLIHVRDASCKVHIRGHLEEIKQAFMNAAERILFGDIERDETEERGVIAVSIRQEIIFSCLDCGARHRIIFVNGAPVVTLERESDN